MIVGHDLLIEKQANRFTHSIAYKFLQMSVHFRRSVGKIATKSASCVTKFWTDTRPPVSISERISLICENAEIYNLI